MTAHAEIIPSVVDRIKRSLVGLKMPRAIEILDATVRRIERGEMNALEAIDALLAEELTLRENRRVKMALVMARLSAIKTLAGFDFSFQPSLDRNRIMALAELQFIDRAEALHLIGPPGTGKSHLSLALGVEAVKAGRSVYFGSLADIIGALAKAEREGVLREKIRFFCRFALLIVDEIGYLPVIPGGGNLFFQLVNARYERGAMILTSNRGFSEWGHVFGDPVVATALLDRLLHDIDHGYCNRGTRDRYKEQRKERKVHGCFFLKHSLSNTSALPAVQVSASSPKPSMTFSISSECSLSSMSSLRLRAVRLTAKTDLLLSVRKAAAA